MVQFPGSNGTIWPSKILYNFSELFWSIRGGLKKATIIVAFNFVKRRLKTCKILAMISRCFALGRQPFSNNVAFCDAASQIKAHFQTVSCVVSNVVQRNIFLVRYIYLQFSFECYSQTELRSLKH